MAYADEREALRIYSDPMISPEEKIRLLSQAPANDGPDLRTAERTIDLDKPGAQVTDAPREVPGAAPPVQSMSAEEAAQAGQAGAEAARHGAPESMSERDKQNLDRSLSASTPSAGAQVADEQARLDDLHRRGQILDSEYEQKTAQNNGQGITVVPTSAGGAITPVSYDPNAEASVQQRGPGDYRSALRLFPTGGGKAVPQEQVRIEEQRQQGTLNPEQAADLYQAKEGADQANIEAATIRAGIEENAAKVQIAAQEDAQRERDNAASIQRAALARAQTYRDKQDRVSQEIANTDPEHADLWAGKDFGSKLLSALSVGLYGLGGGDSMAMVKSLAQREADRQARVLQAKQGAVNAYGTIIERAMANYQDADLAKKQTIVDILGKAELETQKLAQPGMSDIALKKIQAQAEQLRAARLEEQASLDQKLGDKVTTATTIQFARAHQAAQAQRAAAVPAAAPPGSIPARGGAVRTVSAVPGTVSGTPPTPAARPASPEEAIAQGQQLWESGHPREALALLPPAVRAGVAAQARRSKKGLGEGATDEDALAYALNDALHWQVPAEFVPQSARAKMVTLPGGTHGFVGNAAEVEPMQKALDADKALISTYGLLLNLAKKPSSAWSPEDRTKLKGYSTLIKPALSVSNGQGALSEPEQELYNAVSGGDINGFQDWLVGTGKAAAQAGLDVARTRMRARMQSISKDPFDVVPLGAASGGN